MGSLNRAKISIRVITSFLLILLFFITASCPAQALLTLPGNALILGNANLSDMELSTCVLGFNPNTTTYNINTDIQYTTVQATAADPKATITVNGIPAVSGQWSDQVTFDQGPNTIIVKVTASDGITVKTYTINVTCTIPVPVITSPAAGDQWIIGSVKNITWTNPIGGACIQLMLTTQDDEDGTNISSLLPASQSQYSWTVPNISTTKAQIRMVIYKQYVEWVIADVKSADFTITSSFQIPALPEGCAAPTDLSCKVPSSTEIDLSWTDNSNKETSYSVERKTGNGSYAVIAKLPANTTKYADMGLSPATTYTYRVQAIGNGIVKNSDYSNESSAATQDAAAYFIVNAPTIVTLGTAFTFNMAAMDSDDQPVSNYSGKVHFTCTDPVATLPADAVLTNGTGSFSATLNTAGSQTITATDTTNGLLTGKTMPIMASALQSKPSSDDNLSGLLLSAGALTPVFDKGTVSYAVTTATNATTVTPVAEESHATITVNGAAVASGQASPSIALTAGQNDINVSVTAQDGTATKIYAIVVTAQPTASSPGTTPAPSAQTVLKFNIGSTSCTVNGQPQAMDTAPVIKSGRTLLPIRYVAMPLGAVVGWDQEQQKVSVSLGDKKIDLWIGQATAQVNGASTPIDPNDPTVMPVVVPPGRTMLPLRFIAEQLGCKVDWDQSTQTVTVTFPS